LRVSFVSMLCS